MTYTRAILAEQRGTRRALAVVGGGAAAVSLLDALAEADGPPGDITVFEDSPHLWRGRPYQPDLDAVKVNIPPEGMSARFGDTTLFRRWLADRDRLRSWMTGTPDVDYLDALCGLRFVPRAMFGDYLERSAREILVRLLERGWGVEIVREPVSAVLADDGRLRLRTAQDHDFSADHLVLCVGRGAPPDIYGLSGSPGFLADPYPIARSLHEIEPTATVGVLGSGLTGVDVVLGLAALGHRGRIRLMSRSGALPMVRQRPFSHQFRHVTAERFRDAATRSEQTSLAELAALMRADLAEIGVDFDPALAGIADAVREDPLTLLRRDLAQVDSADVTARVLQQAVPAVGPDVWPLLPEPEREYLLRNHYRTMLRVCCPMPPSGAVKLLELADAGRLEVVPGVQDITARKNGGFQVATIAATHSVDFVVNAVNVHSQRIPGKAERLVDSLVDGGLAERHPHGGLHVERATSRLVVKGIPSSRLFVLGDLASGSLFFTFGLPSLVDRAYDIAATLTELAYTEGAGQMDGALQKI